MEPELSTSHHLDAMNAKLDELLVTCSEIKKLKNEMCRLREEMKDLKDSLNFANQGIERPRSLNPGKAIAMVICPIIIRHFTVKKRRFPLPALAYIFSGLLIWMQYVTSVCG